MRKVAQEFNSSPEGIAHNKLLATGMFNEGINADDFAIEIPDIPSLDDYDFLENFDRGEKW